MRHKEPAGDFSTALLSIGPDNYWMSQIGMTADNSSSNKQVRIDNWRPDIGPRVINVDKDTSRYLIGLRGTTDSGWSWETALLQSKAKSEDFTQNRLSNSLLQAGLNDATSSAINIFSSDVKASLAPAIIDVYRNDTSELNSLDFKASNPALFEMPAGPVALLFGLEYRQEKYSDDRDPRLDGTIKYTSVVTGLTFPFVGDVLGSSPTVDVYGVKRVESAFMEMIVPITEKMDAQIAVRNEDFSDTEATTVGRIALGYVVNDLVKLRASFSTAFRSPNILQINQPFVTRTGTRNDAVQEYRIYKNNNDVRPPSGSGFANDYTISNTLHFRLGNPDLLPEESDNATFGVVITPNDSLTVTVDTWSIEKDNTIGLFGRNNSSVYDLLLRIQQGIGGATTVAEMLAFCEGKNVLNNQFGKYALDGSYVLRDADPTSSYDDDFFNAGICPAGQQDTITEPYQNLALRTVEGTDIAVYYDFETSIGDFSVTLQTSMTDKLNKHQVQNIKLLQLCLLYTSPSPRDGLLSRMPSSA